MILILFFGHAASSLEVVIRQIKAPYLLIMAYICTYVYACVFMSFLPCNLKLYKNLVEIPLCTKTKKLPFVSCLLRELFILVYRVCPSRRSKP